MNRLLKQGAIDKAYKKKEGYHRIRIVEIEPSEPQRFVSYFSESMKMFEDASKRAEKAFGSVGL